jgi:DNA uptake protein ComE-like DNA-binding protein
MLAATLTACEKKGSEKLGDSAGGTVAGARPAAAPATEPAPTPAPASAGALLDPNTATKEQLAAMPGMTSAAADTLVAGRPFADMVAVDKALAPHVKDRKSVYAHVFKPIDLNKAGKAEMQLIPGVGPKMTHEFEEYRPWTSVDQFRREIGKYVDKNEVARLEKYVSIH